MSASASDEAIASGHGIREYPLLLGLLLLYTAASLLHFAHNAEYLADYPNLPDSFTRARVYLAWGGLALVGMVGFLVYRTRWRLAGLSVLGLYAALGFDGLLHYTRAPLAAHTGLMNFTILFEVVAAAALLAFVVVAAVRNVHGQARTRRAGG